MSLLLNKSNVLVFNKSQILTRLIKHYCGANVQVLFCHNIIDLKAVDLNSVSDVYFYVESRSETKILFDLQKYVKTVYVITELDLQGCFPKGSNITIVENHLYPNNLIYDIYQKVIELDNF